MVPGALAMIVANAAVLLASHALLDRVRTGKPSTDLTLFLLLRLLLVSAAVLAAGMLHLLTPLGLGIAGAAVLALLIARGAHRRLPRWSPGSWGPLWIAFAAVLGLRLLLQVWFFAPSFEDSLAYHLPKIAEWVRAGAFTGEHGLDVRATFPAGFELVETWWVVFLHHDVLIEMAGVEFLLLGGAALHALASGLGWSTRAARVSTAFFVLGPALYFQATSCVNDGAVAALIVAASALIVAQAPPLLVLLPVAFGAGVKPTFLYALPGLVVLAALIPSRGDDPLARRGGTLAAIAGAALLVGAWWYLRNWIVFGNPIHPMGPRGMKSMVTGSTIQRVGPSLRSLEENLNCFFDLRIYDNARPPDALGTATVSWGASAFALGSTALVPLLRADALLRRVALALTFSALCVFALVELDLWDMRFVMFFTALPALALGRLWERHRFVRVLGVVAMALQFAGTFVPGNLSGELLPRMARQGWRDRASTPLLPDAPSGQAAYLCDDFGGSYPLYGPSYSRSVVYLRDGNADALLSHLDRDRIAVIYVAGSLKRSIGMLEEGVRRGRLKPFDRDGWKGYFVLPPG